VTDSTIIQAGSGYDISCGVVYVKVPGLSAEDVADWDRRAVWIREVEARVATGVGSKRAARARRISATKADQILRYGAKAIGVHADVCERQYIEVAQDADLKSIDRAYQKSSRSRVRRWQQPLHEMQVDRDTGEVWVMVHCGSARLRVADRESLFLRRRCPSWLLRTT
jgi:RNA-splicing ligase RtcB